MATGSGSVEVLAVWKKNWDASIDHKLWGSLFLTERRPATTVQAIRYIEAEGIFRSQVATYLWVQRRGAGKHQLRKPGHRRYEGRTGGGRMEVSLALSCSPSRLGGS
jgi:hypothetical protein